MNVLDKSIVEAIRSAYAAPTPEGISSKSDERQGVMARTQSKVSKALEDTAQDAMASIQSLVGKTMEARTDKDISMKELGKLIMDATDPQEPAPVSEDPDREFYQSGVSIEDRFPETNLSDIIADESTAPLSEVDPERRDDEEFLRTGDLPAAETGEGLMSPVPKAEPETAAETATSSYSATTDAVYTDFYDNNEEGDAAHVGLDSQNLTLPAGIVADGGVTYDGKEVKAGKNTVKASAFDASKVDMSKAYKKVGGKTYKRADYDSDESWSKAVIEAFKDVVKSGAGDSWDNLDDGTKQAITKLAWNNGEGWANYNTSKALSKELAKETKDKAIVAAGILNYSTVAGGGASIGVSKARANAWNKMADEHGFAEITKIEADNTGSKTKFNYYDVDGNLVHTETTSRSPTIYANGSNEKVEKDSEGNW